MCIYDKFEELNAAYSLLQDENTLLLQEKEKLEDLVINTQNIYWRENKRVQQLEKECGMIDTERHRDLTEREQMTLDIFTDYLSSYPYVIAEDIGEAWQAVLKELENETT